MSRSLLHDWEYDIRRCCREDIPMEMMDIAEDIYNTAYARGKNHSIENEESLDKIRAEIMSLTNGDTPERIWNVDVLKIIDKYKK